jgi:hypothetical protein
MRGRVSSVSMLFIGASNELGDAFTGHGGADPRRSRRGGVRRHGRVGRDRTAWAAMFPRLRKADKLS